MSMAGPVRVAVVRHFVQYPTVTTTVMVLLSYVAYRLVRSAFLTDAPHALDWLVSVVFLALGFVVSWRIRSWGVDLDAEDDCPEAAR